MELADIFPVIALWVVEFETTPANGSDEPSW
jgi:hypothetical protein